MNKQEIDNTYSKKREKEDYATYLINEELLKCAESLEKKNIKPGTLKWVYNNSLCSIKAFKKYPYYKVKLPLRYAIHDGSGIFKGIIHYIIYKFNEFRCNYYE